MEVSHKLDEDMLKITKNENDAYIQTEFIVGLLNKDLLTTFKIPLIMTHVKKEDFIII
jgi:hypothetical protein